MLHCDCDRPAAESNFPSCCKQHGTVCCNKGLNCQLCNVTNLTVLSNVFMQANSTAVAHISTAAPSTRAATASYRATPTCTATQLQPQAKTNSSSCLIQRDSSPSQPQESNSPFPSCYANSRSNSNHSNSPSPSQYLPSQPSPSPSKSPSMSPCPRQHPYLMFQPAAQYPSPGERPRAGTTHSLRRAPSVEAESPAESQVSPCAAGSFQSTCGL